MHIRWPTVLYFLSDVIRDYEGFGLIFLKHVTNYQYVYVGAVTVCLCNYSN